MKGLSGRTSISLQLQSHFAGRYGWWFHRVGEAFNYFSTNDDFVNVARIKAKGVKAIMFEGLIDTLGKKRTQFLLS
jgi:hypothetical protein